MPGNGMQQQQVQPYPGSGYDYQSNFNMMSHDPAFGLDPTLLQTNNLRYMPPEYHAKVNPGNIRTIYFGSLPDDCIPEDICNVIRSGLVEKISILLPEKACAFITFMDARAASLVYFFAESRGIVIRGRRVKCGWGKPTRPLASQLMYAVSSGASRNVYIGQLPSWLMNIKDDMDVPIMSAVPETGEGASDAAQAQLKARQLKIQQAVAAELLADFAIYGEVEVIHVLPEKQVAFINYLDIRSSMRAVEEAPTTLRQKYGPCRIAYGKDRCASDVRLPREAGLSIGGMIPRRMTGSYAPGAGSSNTTLGGYGNPRNNTNGAGNTFGRSLELPTRPSVEQGDGTVVMDHNMMNLETSIHEQLPIEESMNSSLTPPVLLELTPEPEDQTI
jgi:hypothetical protein